ncbi:Npt1/Npt2 family nucleotide transporter [Candidatus Neptunochlamydia vexilliferae]|uniref:ADP,ATP carrier protein n=1 Tax=Candidatus Neptunichlamydia vexilliferae TaxID=1651774 RepID=A0ABS0AY95_9BACT|nr:Npt1/Npt2 family nucleotide transporter [Candidatus Neptunochlamydia vexilliferae]MBF5059099.1 ADP,ATP carrier protein 1 [Candidatus Neptunochlamydia vexilliferae]
MQVASEDSWIKKLWPVQRFEHKKVVPLLFLKFLASLVYATLTCMKDSLIVTANHSGAEVIPVLKGWIVFPLSLLCAIAYSKLSNHYKRSTLFYGIITFFLVIVAVYGFFLYPNADLLSPHASADRLTSIIGAKYTHWVSVYRNWIHALFFVTAELWAQVVIFILYWGFANHICQVKEAKRTYTLFIAAGDLATIIAGPLVLYYVGRFTGGDFARTLQTLISYILAAGGLILVTYWWMNKYVLSDKRYYDPAVTKQSLNAKTKLTLRKSIKHIFSSKYLLCIAVLVIGCALTINMVEVTWKAHLKALYPTTADYLAFTSKATTIVGVAALLTVLLLGGSFLRRFGWHFSAQIAPITIGATGAVFFVLSYFRDSLGPLASFFGTTPLMILVLVGAFQSITSKVVKYSFFDSTKEMAYIPLDPESKVKGKAAIDMVGSRLGKSSSSWLQVGLMSVMGTGSVLLITPYLIPIVLGMSLYWSYSARYLSKELSAKEEALADTPSSQEEETPAPA